MISVHEARKKIDEAVKPLTARKMLLADATGCSLSEAVVSPVNVPDFVSSIMDGIALRYADLAGQGPWRLPIQTVIGAGKDETASLKPGHAVKIMTGAKLIAGSDTVVKVEDVAFDNGSVIIHDRVDMGTFVRPLGDDIMLGNELFQPGTIVTPVVSGVLASIGLDRINAIPYPKVTIISTGSEIIEPGRSLKPGQRYDSNRITLYSLLKHDGIPASEIRNIIPDHPGQLEQVLARSLQNSDLVITSGGVSMGDFDYIPDVVTSMGGEILFHKVKVKPGKPVLVAKVRDSWLIGLPGNPVSVVAGYHLHVRRVIARMMGKELKIRSAMARVDHDVNYPTDRFAMVGARLEDIDGEIRATPALRQQSGRLSSVADINGFIMMDENINSIPAGDSAPVEWLY